MARPKSPQPTELSLFIRSLRGRLGLSQLELVDRLNQEIAGGRLGEPLPEKYVSLVETGSRRSLEERFYQALGKLSGQPPDKLKDLHLLRAPQRLAAELSVERDSLSARRVRLAAGHVVWCAPIIAAALEGRLPDLEVTTFADSAPGSSQPSIERAVWIRSDDLPKIEDLARRSPGPNQQPDPVKSEGKTTVPLSANDVLRWLSEEVIDIAAVPRDLIRENRDLMRIGTLVDSAAGCILICDEPLAKSIRLGAFGASRSELPIVNAKRPAHETHISTNDLLKALRASQPALNDKYASARPDRDKIREKSRDITPRIAAEAGTIAMAALEKTLDSESRPADLLKVAWDLPARDLAKSTYWSLDAEVRHSLAGVVAWEPHAHWLQRNSDLSQSPIDPENRVACFPLQLSPNELGRPQHLEFDLVILRKNSENPLLKRVFYDLLWKTWQAATEIGQMRPGAFHKHLRPLAAYFDLGDWDDISSMSEVVSHVIGGVRFAVSLDIENQHEFIQR
jgi:transcriptional regulator with XRE-family HTH domain